MPNFGGPLVASQLADAHLLPIAHMSMPEAEPQMQAAMKYIGARVKIVRTLRFLTMSVASVWAWRWPRNISRTVVSNYAEQSDELDAC